MSNQEESWDEVIHSTAIRYLLDRNHRVAAAILLNADLRLEMSTDHWMAGDRALDGWHVYLILPLQIRDKIDENQQKLIEEALGEAFGSDDYLRELHIEMPKASAGPRWRESYWRQLEGKDITNQARLIANPPFTYNSMGFRSKTEVRICQALEQSGALLFPLPLADYKGDKKEPDFLVSFKGKWGILEVAGKPYHPPSRAAEDHERARWFEHKGIRVHIFDAERCYNHPKQVVTEFLDLITK